MPDKVDIRVSPALDPETYRSVEGYDDDTRGYVDDVVNTFHDIYLTVGKVHDARKLWADNPAETPEKRTIIVGNEAAKQKERVLTRLARAERDLRARIDQTEGELTRPLTQRAGVGTLNDAVRGHVKSLERAEREVFMRDAMNSDDDLTLTALLGAPPYLSGMTKVDHDHFVRKYHEKREPALVRRLDVMQRVLGMVERNGPVVHAQFDKAVGAKASVVRQLDHKNEQAKASLNIQPTV